MHCLSRTGASLSAYKNFDTRKLKGAEKTAARRDLLARLAEPPVVVTTWRPKQYFADALEYRLERRRQERGW